MRDRFRATFALALAVSASGCYVSLHPVVTKDIRVFEPALVGSWEEKGNTDPEVWVFKPTPADEPEAYIVEITQMESKPFSDERPAPVTASFDGRLGRLGDLLVLEIVPDRKKALGPLEEHELVASSLVPAYTFFRVRLEKETLTLMAVDSKWMDKAIASKAIQVPHEHLDTDANPHEGSQPDLHLPRSGPEGQDFVLLTAPTGQLQALVRQHGKSGLFDEENAGEFVRRK
jgi:hypothetical protein